jgi:hypothetical protein
MDAVAFAGVLAILRGHWADAILPSVEHDWKRGCQHWAWLCLSPCSKLSIRVHSAQLRFQAPDLPASHLTERYLVEGELMATFCADTIGPVLKGNGPRAPVIRMMTTKQGEE